MRATRLFAFVLPLALVCQVPTARADDAATPADQNKQLHFSPVLDGTLTGVGLVGFLVPELAKSSLAPNGCRICHRMPDGTVSVNAFDRTIRNGLVGAFGVQPATWARTSDVMAFGVLPVLAMGADFWLANDARFDRHLATDIGVVAEGVLLAGALDQCVKFLVARQRPFIAYQNDVASLRHGTETSADDNLSFYSGHSSAAMSMTVGVARVIQLRTGKMIGYYTLVPLGILTSLMRVAADKHWATDVITGMAVGTATGLILPSLHQ